MKKDRKKIDKEIWLVIGLLLFVSITPVSAEFELGQFWSLKDDTIVQTNTTHNVNIGENDTTDYKLKVNGTTFLDGNLTLPLESKLFFGSGKDAYIYREEDGDFWIIGTGLSGGDALDFNSWQAVAFDTIGQFTVLCDNALNLRGYGGTVRVELLASGIYFTAGNNDDFAFNFAKNDVDLFVRGITDDNLFFIDASKDNIGIGTNTPMDKLNVVGNVNVTGNINVTEDIDISGDLIVSKDIVHHEDVDTKITFEDDNILFRVGHRQFLRFDEGVVDAFLIDPLGSGILVGIGTDSPTETLNVRGNIDAIGNVNVTGDINGSSYTSTVATGTSPYRCSSTTLNTNFNADMVDGKSVGTFGNVIPLLDEVNYWSGSQIFSGNTHLYFRSGGASLYSPSVGVLRYFVSGLGARHEWVESATELMRSSPFGIVMNEGGGGLSAPLRVEGNNDVNLLYVRGATDRVGIGTNNPNAKLQVIGVTNSTGGFATDTGVGWSGTYTVDEGIVTVRNGIIIDVDWE